MKNKLLILGILILIVNVSSCFYSSIYEDDFEDSSVNYEYWGNSTDGVTFTEIGGYTKISIFSASPSDHNIAYYIPIVSNSDIFGKIHFSMSSFVEDVAIMYFWDGEYGIYCWIYKYSTQNRLYCKAIPNNSTTQCNTYGNVNIYNSVSIPTNNYTWKTSHNQVNFSVNDVLKIQCNNTFLKDSRDVKLEFRTIGASNTFDIQLYDFIHGNQTFYHENIWTVKNYYTGEPLNNVNISIENVTYSANPIPESCITGSDGKCSFLYDYNCDIPCDALITIDGTVSDNEVESRFSSDNYQNVAIGRDHIYSPSYLMTAHRVYLDSHMVEFDIQDYSHNPINNVYVEAENVIGVINYCITNSSGKCKIQLLSNSTYTISIDGGYKYFVKTTSLRLSPYVSYNINQSYFLETLYSNEVNLTLTIKDATKGIINYNGTIKIMYLSGYSTLYGFTWYIPIINGTGNYMGLPKGTYEFTIYNKTDYYFYRYSEEEYLGDYYDFFNVELILIQENKFYYVKEWIGIFNVSGRVFGATNWSNWDAGIFIGLNNTEVSYGNQYYTYTDITDSNGIFALPNIKAGEYYVFVYPPIEYQPYQEIRLVDQNRLGLYYYCKPNEPEPTYNISIYGYVDFNGTKIPSLSIRVIPERGNIETIYTNTNGFYNWSREWNVPQTITMIFNYNSHVDEYETVTQEILLTISEKTQERNVSLDIKTLWWEVIGNFKDSENNLVLCNWNIKIKNSNLTIRSGFNENVFHIYDLEPNIYVMYISGDFVGDTEKQFELSDSYEFWKYKNGIFDLETIYVYPIIDFYDYYFIIKEIIHYEGYSVEMDIPKVTINFKGIDYDYDRTVTTGSGFYYTLYELPAINYILTISKTGYTTYTETDFMGSDKTLNLTLKESGFGVTTTTELEAGIQEMINEWGLILGGLVGIVIFLFFGSMIFEFLDKIGGK